MHSVNSLSNPNPFVNSLKIYGVSPVCACTCEHKSEAPAARLPDSQVVWLSDHPISVQLCAVHAEFQSLRPSLKISVYLQSLIALPGLVFPPQNGLCLGSYHQTHFEH